MKISYMFAAISLLLFSTSASQRTDVAPFVSEVASEEFASYLYYDAELDVFSVHEEDVEEFKESRFIFDSVGAS